MNIDYKKIGQLIRDTREDKDISQKKLAELMGMDKTKINRIESGIQPIQLNEFFQIAEILEVSPNYLLRQDIVPRDEVYVADKIEKLLEIWVSNDDSRLGDKDAYSYEDLIFSISGDYIALTGKDYLFSFIKNLAEANKLRQKMPKAYDEQVRKAIAEFLKCRKKDKRGSKSIKKNYFLIKTLTCIVVLFL